MQQDRFFGIHLFVILSARLLACMHLTKSALCRIWVVKAFSEDLRRKQSLLQRLLLLWADTCYRSMFFASKGASL